MAKFVVEYGKDTAPPAANGRLKSPTFQRNHDAIWSRCPRSWPRKAATSWNWAAEPASTPPNSPAARRI